MLCFCRRAYYGLNRNGSAEGSERHRQFLGDDTASGIQSHLRPSKPCHQHPEEGPRDGQIFGEGCVNFEDTPNRVHHHLLRYHPGSWRSSWNHQDAPQGHEGSYLGSIIILWYLRETVVDCTQRWKQRDQIRLVLTLSCIPSWLLSSWWQPFYTTTRWCYRFCECHN